MSGKRYRSGSLDDEICGWGRCGNTTNGYPLCETHLQRAWAIVQARLNEEQAHNARHGGTPE